MLPMLKLPRLEQPTVVPSINATALELLPALEPGIHPAARAEGMARAFLAKAWHGYKSSFEQSGKSLVKANEEFETLYNSGALAPQIFNTLGPLSWKTISRWAQADPDRTYNYMLYLPQYKYSGATTINTSLSFNERKTFEKFILDPRQHKIARAISYTREILKIHDIETKASDTAFRRYADWFKKAHADVWKFLREGQKALTDEVIFSITRDPLRLDVGQCLVADGHRLNFQIINPFTGKPGRASMIGYQDWRSRDLVGYEIMMEENTQVIASALRNSILYMGKLPKYCYQDNGKAFRAKYFTSSPSFEESMFVGLFGRFAITPIFALPYNARAKTIEGFWSVFSSFERLMISYSGTSIADKPAYMMRNEKWHRIMRGDYVPDVQEVIEMIDAWLQLWRHETKCPHDPEGRTIEQVIESGKGPGADVDELDDLMMETRAGRIRANGILHRGEYYWAEELYGKKWEEVTIKYSLFDKQAVRVYSKTGQRICIARRWDAQHPLVNYEGTEEEKARFKDVISLQRRLQKTTMDKVRLLMGTPQPLRPLATPPYQGGEQREPLMMKEVQEKKRHEVPADSAISLSAYLPREDERAESARPIFTSETDRDAWEEEHGES